MFVSRPQLLLLLASASAPPSSGGLRRWPSGAALLGGKVAVAVGVLGPGRASEGNRCGLRGGGDRNPREISEASYGAPTEIP